MRITENARQNHATISLFNTSLRRTGHTLPDAPTLGITAPVPPSEAEVLAAAVQALQAGKDPATDKDVQRLTTGYQLGRFGLSEQIEMEDSKAKIQHIIDHVPALLEKLTEEFDAAVDTMRGAIPIIGHMDLSNGVQFKPGNGKKKVVALAEAAEANHTASIIGSTWPAFLRVIGEVSHRASKNEVPLWYSAPTAQQANGLTTDASPWDMLNKGITASLATSAEEHQDRAEQLEREQQEIARVAEDDPRTRKPNYLQM